MSVRNAALSGLLAVAASLAIVARYPIVLPTEETEVPAPRPTSVLASAEAVLVASPDRVRQRSLAGRDDTFAWVSFLEQEIGPWRLAEPARLDAADLAEARLVIVPRTAWDDLTEGDRGALRAAAAAGATVVAVEGPPERAAGIGGRVVAVPDFAAPLAAAQQGRRAVERADFPGVPQGLVQPHGFLADDARVAQLEPVVDIAEGRLLGQIEDVLPVAGWWRFPDAAPAYVAVTYDEEGCGDRSAWLPRALADQGVATTAFVETEAITPAGVAALREARSDVHLHWDRGFLGTEPRMPVRIAGLAAAERRPALTDQTDRAHALGMGEPGVVLSRVHGLVFDADPARTFRILHAAGVEVDSTYGPAGSGRFGYLFGTGLPFRPLDSTGWPFPLLEVPFLFQDDEEWSRELQDRIVREAATVHHQLVVTVFHVNAMERKPAAELIEGTLAIGETATAAGAQHGSLLPFVRHWRARLASPLRTSGDARRVRVELDAQADGMAVRVPAVAGARATVDGAEVETVVHGRHLVVPVPRGPHVVEVRW